MGVGDGAGVGEVVGPDVPGGFGGSPGGAVLVGGVAPSPLPASSAPIPPATATPAPTIATVEIPPATKPAGTDGNTAAGAAEANGAAGVSFRHSPALKTIIGSNCAVRPTSISRLVTST